MKTSYKLFLIFGPIILVLLNGFIASYSFFQWGYDNKNQISIALLAISGAGSLAVFVVSLKNKQKKWSAISLIMGVLSFIIAYLIKSLSSFGF